MTFEQRLRAIFDDMRDCAAQIAADREKFIRRFPLPPPSIGVGNGQMIYLSEKGVAAINAIARTYRENSPEYRRALPHNEMVELVARAIGSVISASASAGATELAIPADPDAFWIALRDQLAGDLKELNRELAHLFGAWVIQGDTIPSIDIGPVRFSLRAQWVRDAVAAGVLTESRASRLSYHWEHGGTVDPDAAEGIEGYTVKEIADAVGPCPWVCAVRVYGHTHTRSRQKALLAARITLAAISLAWDDPSHQAKETGLIYDIGPHRIRHTVMLGNHFVGADHESLRRLGRFLTIGDATAFKANTSLRLETVGAALDTFLSTNPIGPKRLLEEALCHALIWFGEACNEPLEFMSIVKFVAALDTLAKGRQVRGICELVQRRYPVRDMEAPFLSDGTSARQLVEQIYETGRSRIVHGTRSSLIDDLEQLRARAELLATIVLRACTHWLDSYTGPDDVDAFATSP
jgi:hypothetical protein